MLELLAKLCGYDKAVETLIDSFVIGHLPRCLVIEKWNNVLFLQPDKDNWIVCSRDNSVPQFYVGIIATREKPLHSYIRDCVFEGSSGTVEYA